MLTDYIKTKDDLEGAFLGTLFADGNLAKQRIIKGHTKPSYKNKTYFEVTHISKNLDYLQQLKTLLEKFDNIKCQIVPYNKQTKEKKYLLYRLRTSSIEYFSKLRDQLYKYEDSKRIKLFPKKYFQKLTDLGLYLMYLDDGTLRIRYYKNTSKIREIRTTFYLNSFTLEELKDFQIFLKQKYDIDSKYYLHTKSNTVGRNRGYVIWMNTANTKKFMSIIDRFYNEISSMQYKFVKYYIS